MINIYFYNLIALRTWNRRSAEEYAWVARGMKFVFVGGRLYLKSHDVNTCICASRAILNFLLLVFGNHFSTRICMDCLIDLWQQLHKIRGRFRFYLFINYYFLQ